MCKTTHYLKTVSVATLCAALSLFVTEAEAQTRYVPPTNYTTSTVSVNIGVLGNPSVLKAHNLSVKNVAAPSAKPAPSRALPMNISRIGRVDGSMLKPLDRPTHVVPTRIPMPKPDKSGERMVYYSGDQEAPELAVPRPGDKPEYRPRAQEERQDVAMLTPPTDLAPVSAPRESNTDSGTSVSEPALSATRSAPAPKASKPAPKKEVDPIAQDGSLPAMPDRGELSSINEDGTQVAYANAPSSSNEDQAQGISKGSSIQQPNIPREAVSSTENYADPFAFEIGGRRAYRVMFAPLSSRLDKESRESLDFAISQAKEREDSDIEIQLLAYASGESGISASQARRLSLSRALTVRTYLINRGVEPSLLNVRALGIASSLEGQDQGAVAMDRVDIVFD